MNMIALNVAIPLLSAFLLPILSPDPRSFGRWVGPLVLMFMLIYSLQHYQAFIQPEVIALGGFLPPMGISFHIDQLALLILIAIPALMLMLWPYGKTKSREEALLLLLAGASSGMAMSGDLFNIYVFYELLSVASFGLASATRNARTFAASYRYVIQSSVGTVLALTGIALIYTRTGTLNLAHIGSQSDLLQNPTGYAAFVLILIGIGVKAELFPVNQWVAEVYATASARVTAVFAGLVSKLAVLVIIRLLVVAYGDSPVLDIMLVLGMLGIITGELAAWRCQDMRRMFAYSSIGQLGMIIVAFSIPGEAGMIAGIAIMLHHLVVKPALFLLTEHWHGNIERYAGIARLSPVSVALFVFFALSLIGIPPLPGFWAKLLLVTGLTAQTGTAYLLALIVLLTATVIETHYLMRTARILISGEPQENRTYVGHGVLNTVMISLSAVVLVLALINLSPMAEQLQLIAEQAANPMLYIQTTFPDLTQTGAVR